MSTTVRKILERTLGQTGMSDTRPLMDLLDRIAGVDNIYELRGLNIDVLVVSYGATVTVRGAAGAYDCQARTYVFDALSTDYDDGESVIAPLPDKAQGRWLLRVPSPGGKLPEVLAHSTAAAPPLAPKTKRKRLPKKTEQAGDASKPTGKKAQLPLK